MIESFKSADVQALYKGMRVGRFSGFERSTLRKLRQLDVAIRLDDLRVPPGNCLERLQGDRRGQYSIRINDQWRLCFIWQDGRARDVEIVDYH